LRSTDGQRELYQPTIINIPVHFVDPEDKKIRDPWTKEQGLVMVRGVIDCRVSSRQEGRRE